MLSPDLTCDLQVWRPTDRATTMFARKDNPAVDAVAEAVAETIAVSTELARDVRRGVPKAWGALAAQGVRVYRAKIGRQLLDEERRALWAALWREVNEPR